MHWDDHHTGTELTMLECLLVLYPNAMNWHGFTFEIRYLVRIVHTHVRCCQHYSKRLEFVPRKCCLHIYLSGNTCRSNGCIRGVNCVGWSISSKHLMHHQDHFLSALSLHRGEMSCQCPGLQPVHNFWRKSYKLRRKRQLLKRLLGKPLCLLEQPLKPPKQMLLLV